MFRKSAIVLLLCLAVFVSAFAFSANAEQIIEIDTEGLWGDDVLGGDSGNGNTGDNTGDNNTTYIPEDNPDTGHGTGGNKGKDNGTASVVGPKEDKKDDDKTTVLPTPGANTGNEKQETEIAVADVKFSDIKKTDWFYNDVGALVGMGVINGYPDGTFRPDGNVTRAEFLKLLLTLMAGDELFVSYEKVFDDVDPKEWYSTYIVSAIVYGIIDVNDYGKTFNPDKPITRREVAKFVVKALQVEAGGYKTPYADTADHNIISLYGLGLMQGTVDTATGYRFFYPDTNISRAETSAVILRIYKLSMDGQDYVSKFMKDNNLPPLQSLYVPTTKNDFYNVLSNAWDKNQAFVMYNYDFGAGGEQMRKVREALYTGYSSYAMTHPEYYTNFKMWAEITGDSTSCVMKIFFDSGDENKSRDEIIEETALAVEMADAALDSFIDEKANGHRKADMIHDYIVDSFEYDSEYLPKSYTAYGAMSTGKAVCQGYSSVFNLLCRAAGVKSLAVANDNHMWNAVLIDGKVLFYDTTYDDTGDSKDAFKGVDESTFEKIGKHGEYVVPNVEMFI